MRLARKDELQATSAQQSRQAVRIREQQGGTLVGRKPARKNDREPFGIERMIGNARIFIATRELRPQHAPHVQNQLLAQLTTGVPQCIGRYGSGLLPARAVTQVVPTRIDVVRVEAGHGGRHPGGQVHAVGD